jgi:hypothetical protein
MNKHKYESILNSIQHYQNEIIKLKQTLEVVTDTRNDLIKSLVEFFPFEVDDIIFFNGIMYKVKQPVEGRLNYDQQPTIVVECYIQQRSSGFCVDTDKISNTVENWLKFKKIN